MNKILRRYWSTAPMRKRLGINYTRSGDQSYYGQLDNNNTVPSINGYINLLQKMPPNVPTGIRMELTYYYTWKGIKGYE